MNNLQLTEPLCVPTWADCVDALQTSAENRAKLTDKQRRVLRAIFPEFWNAICARAAARAENDIQNFRITAADFSAVLNEWQTGGDELQRRYSALCVLLHSERLQSRETLSHFVPRAIAENFAARKNDIRKTPAATLPIFADDDITRTETDALQRLADLSPPAQNLALHSVALIIAKHGSPRALQKIARDDEREAMAKISRDKFAAPHILTPPLTLRQFADMAAGGFGGKGYASLETAVRELANKTLAAKIKHNGKAAYAGMHFVWIVDNKTRRRRIGIPTPFLRNIAHYFIPLNAPLGELLRRLSAEFRAAKIRQTDETMPLIFRALTKADNSRAKGKAYIGDDDLRELMPRLAARGIPAAQRRAFAKLNAARRAGFFAETQQTDDGGIVVRAAARRLQNAHLNANESPEMRT